MLRIGSKGHNGSKRWFPNRRPGCLSCGLPSDGTVSILETSSQPMNALRAQRELTHIASLISDARLITLLGTGGSGKTSLALEAAPRAPLGFSGDAWFVDASETRDSTLLAEAIGRTLAIEEQPERELIGSIASALHDQPTLVVLDNLEQNRGTGDVVAHLLRQSVATMIATSRVPLRLSEEMAVPVTPLDVSSIAGDAPPSVAAQNPAMQIFVDRAKQVKPDFTLTDGNVGDVIAICERLDGLPLAIELAAARTRLLHPAALLARLENRLNVLTRGVSTSARQQTLRATIEWSFDLLRPEEQAVFRVTGVFFGWCDARSNRGCHRFHASRWCISRGRARRR
jgi:predicted ATPase